MSARQPTGVVLAGRSGSDGLAAESAARAAPGGRLENPYGWPHVVEALGMPGLHFHDLRHTGNQFAANSGAGLRDLMAHGPRLGAGRDDLPARGARR